MLWFALLLLGIVPRAAWDPAPVPAASLPARTLSSSSFIVIHHSDFPDAPGPLAIKTYHLDVSGFSDIAYHYVVDKDGVVYEGRALDRVGAHAGVTKEQRRDRSVDPDVDSIGIVVDGNFVDTAPTPEQLAALVTLVKDLRTRFHIEGGHVIGHRDVKQRLVEDRELTFAGHETECPGDALWRLLAYVRLFSAPDTPRRQ